MNITIDTTAKTIIINGQVNGKEFMNEIKKLGIDLKEYSFTTKVEYWQYPTINVPFVSTETYYELPPDFITYTQN